MIPFFLSIQQNFKKNKIKSAIDRIPIGVCFFQKDGLPLLCNVKMHEIIHYFLHKDLLMLSELEDALISPPAPVTIIQNEGESLYQLPDMSIWKFHLTTILAEGGVEYIQMTATDYTKLYHLQQNLSIQNEELREMIGQIQHIKQNVAEITRQQEILNAKMRVHNKMGNCLLVARQYVIQDYQREKKEHLINIWKNSLSELMGEIGAKDESDPMEMVIEIAKSIGVDIQIEGELPEDSKTSYMLVVALRECITNTKKHGEGDTLYMKLNEKNHVLNAEFTNNGKQPDKPIIEGGGLSSLREKVTEAGGIMVVSSVPVFRLVIQIPNELSTFQVAK